MFTRERIEEILTTLVTAHDQLADDAKKFADGLKISRDLDPENKRMDDAHRRSAFGRFDSLLESGLLTPDEVVKAKADWDIRHGY